jgi:hypothetical protein
MALPPWAAGVDADTPSPARVYDVFLGGSHHFDADRRMARQLEQVLPDIGTIMRANRSFLRRAVAAMVGCGIRQFLDLGSGIPTVGNVHEVARRTAPQTRVVYVDLDPVAVAHARAVLTGDPLTAVVEADLRRTEQVLTDPATTGLLDLSQPVGVLLLGVLHQITYAEPAELIAGYRQVMTDGSYLALSQASQDHRPREATALRNIYNRGYAPGVELTLRTRAEVLRMFDGFTLVEPGLVQLPEWRPDEPGGGGEHPERYSTYAGVGRLG